jgi:hypothetical protein
LVLEAALSATGDWKAPISPELQTRTSRRRERIESRRGR